MDYDAVRVNGKIQCRKTTSQQCHGANAHKQFEHLRSVQFLRGWTASSVIQPKIKMDKLLTKAICPFKSG